MVSGGEDDRDDGQRPLIGDREPDRGQAGEESEGCQQVGDQPVDRKAGEPPAALPVRRRRNHRRAPSRAGSLLSRSAITVSPPTVFWPTITRGDTPSGR